MEQDFFNFRYRTVKEIKKHISLIEELDPRSIPFEDLFQSIQRLISGVDFPKLAYTIPCEDRSTPYYGIFRARRFYELPKQVKELREPPPEEVKKIGRCNDVGKPMFYCSNHFATSLIECRARKGEIWVIGEYSMKPNNFINMISLGVKNQKILKQAQDFNACDDFLEGLTPDERKKHRLIDDFVHRLFNHYIKPGSAEYFKTFALSKCFLEINQKKHNIAGLSYPSVAAGLKGVNFAIKPTAVTESLNLIKAYCFELTNMDLHNYVFSYNPLYEGSISNGFVTWKDVSHLDSFY